MISVCIPTYEQSGHGARCLKALLDSILVQRSIDFEVIVSDNSRDDKIQNLCGLYMAPGGYALPLRYIRNPVMGVSNNTNNAIENASSNLIKIMYQDDLLLYDDALAKFADALTRKPWVVSSFMSMNSNGLGRRIRTPVWPTNILYEKNTFGMPSIMAHRRDDDIRFDPNLKVRLDCEYYWLFHQKYGAPEYLPEPLVGCRYWHGSISRVQGNDKFIAAECHYLMEKHRVKAQGAHAALTPAID